MSKAGFQQRPARSHSGPNQSSEVPAEHQRPALNKQQFRAFWQMGPRQQKIGALSHGFKMKRPQGLIVFFKSWEGLRKPDELS